MCLAIQEMIEESKELGRAEEAENTRAAEARADAEKARADAAETRADAEKARADAAETRADAEKTRADAAEKLAKEFFLILQKNDIKFE